MNTQVEYFGNKLCFETDPSDLFDNLNDGENIIVVDARKPEAYAAEHITGAINLPHKTITEETTMHLNKNFLYVIYCDGVGCNASSKGAFNMAQLGFTVKELFGGIESWKKDGFATEGAKASANGLMVKCAC
jgi:rhodanese-related sulfurtransferase